MNHKLCTCNVQYHGDKRFDFRFLQHFPSLYWVETSLSHSNVTALGNLLTKEVPSTFERTFTAICTVLEVAYSPTAKQDLYREWAALLVSVKARE